MFINKFKENKITFRNYKNLKYIYKETFYKEKIFLQKFSLFFFYNNFTTETHLNFKKFLNQECLKYSKIKKNILKKFFTKENYLNFNPIIKNNVLVITHKENKDLNLNLFIKSTQLKNCYLLGICLNNKFFRVSEITKLQKLINNSQITSQIFLQKHPLIFLKNTLIFKKIIK